MCAVTVLPCQSSYALAIEVSLTICSSPKGAVFEKTSLQANNADAPFTHIHNSQPTPQEGKANAFGTVGNFMSPCLLEVDLVRYKASSDRMAASGRVV